MPHKELLERNKYQRERYNSNPEVRRKHKECQKRWNERNKARMTEYRKEWISESQAKDPEKWKRKYLKYVLSKWGVTVEWYEQLLKKQSGVCAICGKPETDIHQQTGLSGPRVRRLAIDHDHKTGKIRGLLCGKCNKALHLIEQFDGWEQKAFKYLEHYRRTG